MFNNQLLNKSDLQKKLTEYVHALGAWDRIVRGKFLLDNNYVKVCLESHILILELKKYSPVTKKHELFKEIK